MKWKAYIKSARQSPFPELDDCLSLEHAPDWVSKRIEELKAEVDIAESRLVGLKKLLKHWTRYDEGVKGRREDELTRLLEGKE